MNIQDIIITKEINRIKKFLREKNLIKYLQKNRKIKKLKINIGRGRRIRTLTCGFGDHHANH